MLHPGPFNVCRFDLVDPDSDALRFDTLRWGFDSADEANAAIEEVASEHGVSPDELCVIRVYSEIDFL